MVMFLTEQPDSGMYDNWHIMRQSSHLHPRVYKLDPKTKQMKRGIQDYNKSECPESMTLLPHISPGSLVWK